jgi:hypothetical protein
MNMFFSICRIEFSSLETIVAEQGIIKARYEYQTAEVNATTTVINCQAQANITGTFSSANN